MAHKAVFVAYDAISPGCVLSAVSPSRMSASKLVPLLDSSRSPRQPRRRRYSFSSAASMSTVRADEACSSRDAEAPIARLSRHDAEAEARSGAHLADFQLLEPYALGIEILEQSQAIP